MDVSRIEAVTPKQIDWRKLTAKEIIKYEDLGIEVPSQYLQWAKDFIQEVQSGDNDDTTYEMAASGSSQNATVNAESAASTDTNEQDSNSETEPTTAQQKREDMQNAGVSLRSQAKTFTKDSKEASKEVIQSAFEIFSTEKNSDNEIQALEGHMQEILSKAEATRNELKTEIDAINSNRSDKSTFAKIDKLQKQLEQYGIDGQTEIANSESDFSIYKASINDQSSIILNADDFGTETTAVGKELLDSIGGNFWRIFDYIIAKRAINTGDRTVELSGATAELQTEADTLNNDNISTANGYKSEIQDITGVSGADVKNKNDNSENDGNTGETQNQTAGITETEKAATANLEQILQAKIRKGENTATA